MEDLLIAHPVEQQELASKKKPKPTKEEMEIAEEKKRKEKKFFKRLPPEELRKMSREERQDYYHWLGDRDKEKVTGVFRFFERPGGDLEFVFSEWPGCPDERYHLVDGQTYSISLGAARHLNKNGWYPEYEYIPGGKNINVPDGQPTNMRIGKKVRRYAFQKLDFMEEDMSEYGEPVSGLVSVEYVGNQNQTERF